MDELNGREPMLPGSPVRINPNVRVVNDPWYHGFAVAVAELARWGNRDLARTLMNSCGVTVAVLEKAGCEEFDLEVIRPVMEAERPVRRRRQGKWEGGPLYGDRS